MMRRNGIGVLVAALWLAVSVPVARAEAPLIVFPQAAGSEWTYQNGAMRITERIAGYEKIGDERCAKVETVYDGKVIAAEHLAFRPDGVYRVAIAGQKIEPAFLFLKLPPRHGDQWHVKCRIGQEDLSGDFNALIGKVKVPAGEFQALSVVGKNFKAGKSDLETEMSFAPGVGKVKHIVRIDGKETVLELVSFRPGTEDPAASPAKPAEKAP